MSCRHKLLPNVNFAGPVALPMFFNPFPNALRWLSSKEVGNVHREKDCTGAFRRLPIYVEAVPISTLKLTRLNLTPPPHPSGIARHA